MSITDELREYARGCAGGMGGDAMRHIADRIDAEHESAMYNMRREFEEWKHTQDTCYVKLPKDADGVPIRVGDVLTDGEYTFVVDELAAFGDGSWSIRNEDGNAWAACDVTHHHEPTVEDVLREFAYGLGVPVADSYIAASAAKLRLAGDAE
jgi:hypothetical protein